ncbi:Hypothetical protein CAP_0516 [Chondromyces apiculatus DSM 436]|uniref:Uncharacterized protein n=1 Tax=Chondromyces apiculatus DSM 436 TaxID=1192034 RepID=A0A017SUC3_9BACT|nr:Hypothetical protein CAP_0516 [Chondromyces apiculatus DSM 436]
MAAEGRSDVDRRLLHTPQRRQPANQPLLYRHGCRQPGAFKHCRPLKGSSLGLLGVACTCGVAPQGARWRRADSLAR